MTLPRERRYRREWLLLASVLLLLAALIGNWIAAERARIGTMEGDRLQVQARVIEENLTRQLEAVSVALAGIRSDLVKWEDGKVTVGTSRRLGTLSDVMVGVRTLLVADADGKILDSNRKELVGQSMSGRETFKTPRARPDADMLYVASPFKSKLGVYVLGVSRAIIGPDGKFAGVVSAALDPEYFYDLLESVLYTPDMRASLAHGDGVVFLFAPHNPDYAGKDLSRPGSLYTRHKQSALDVTLMTGNDYATGAARMMAQRTLKRTALRMDKSLSIGVSRELSAIFGPWRKLAFEYTFFFGLFALIAAFTLLLIERRRRGAELAQSAQEKADQLLRHFFNLPFVGMAVTAPGTKHWLHFNDLLCQILGYSREELAGKTWDELTHPDDLGSELAEFERLLCGEIDSYAIEKRFMRKDGGEVLTMVDVKCTRKDDASVDYIIATVQDISERKRREEEYRTVIQASTDGFWITDTEGRILDANEAICRMLGYTREELLGLSLRDIDANEAPQEVMARTQALMSAGGAQFQVQHRRKDGRVIDVEVSVQYVARLGPRLFAFVRDITERKRSEAERALLESQLRESQKMEALGTLAGGVAHDFNNIVATMLGNVELAARDVGPGHRAHESLDEIRKASVRAKNLVQQILAFGRRQLMERKVISLAPVVAESVRLLRSTLPAGVRVDVECAPDAPSVLADAHQIQQVLLNLCTNAWQAMQGQVRAARIDVGLTLHLASAAAYDGPERRSGNGRVSLHPGRYACISVGDCGPGMDHATRSRIFEPFFTTKPVGQGTGLGLAVVHGIVQEHGGSIAVQTAPGDGATFRIYLPEAEEAGRQQPANASAAPEPAAQQSPGAGPQGNGRCILYIDDDEAIVFLMTRLLEREGYRVSSFTDAREALDSVRARPQDFDLVVTDYNMPDISGLEVARLLHEIRPDLPVAMATGYITEELRQEAPAAGVSELLYKPNTVDELCAAIARLACRLTR